MSDYLLYEIYFAGISFIILADETDSGAIILPILLHGADFAKRLAILCCMKPALRVFCSLLCSLRPPLLLHCSSLLYEEDSAAAVLVYSGTEAGRVPLCGFNQHCGGISVERCRCKTSGGLNPYPRLEDRFGYTCS